MARAHAEGLSGVTHLFNAMSQLGSREPGVVGAAMSDLGLAVGIIADGHHVAWPSFQAAFRAIGPERMMLVTDAMAAAGCSDGDYVLGDLPVEVVSGTARIAGTDTIAGSTLVLSRGVQVAIEAGHVHHVTADLTGFLKPLGRSGEQ